jgi:hypothetical protein
MKNITQLKNYAELFKKNISPFLAPGVAIKTTIYPAENDGAVFEFFLNKGGDTTEVVDVVRPTIQKVLSRFLNA